MRKKSNKVSLKPVKHRSGNWLVTFPDGGARRKKYFKNKTGKGNAQEWADTKQAEIDDEGSKHETFSEDERNAVIAFRMTVATLPGSATGTKLSDVVTDYIGGLMARNKSISCQAVADSLIDELYHAGRSKKHMDGTRQKLNRFNVIYGDRMACDITTDIVRDFLSNEITPKSRPHYRQALVQLFNHAGKLNASPSNPVLDVIKPKVEPSDTGILKPQELAKLLVVIDEDSLPPLAISFFAGVRRAEIERLDWSEVDLDEGFIEITAKNAKTAQRRLIPISDNLREWLLPHAKHEGKVMPSERTFRRHMGKAILAAELESWPRNAGRHSFASYHLAANDDPGKLAMALGHPDPRLLFKHYRQLVTAKAAKTYWSITPEKTENITNIKTA